MSIPSNESRYMEIDEGSVDIEEVVKYLKTIDNRRGIKKMRFKISLELESEDSIPSSEANEEAKKAGLQIDSSTNDLMVLSSATPKFDCSARSSPRLNTGGSFALQMLTHFESISSETVGKKRPWTQLEILMLFLAMMTYGTHKITKDYLDVFEQTRTREQIRKKVRYLEERLRKRHLSLAIFEVDERDYDRRAHMNELAVAIQMNKTYDDIVGMLLEEELEVFNFICPKK